VPSSFRLTILGLALSLSLPAQSLLDVMREELDRNFAILKEKSDPPAYFAAYTITDVESRGVSSTMGTLQGSSNNHSRLLDVTVRVGTPKLDNYHKLPGENPRFSTASQVTVEDNIPALRRALWLETDRTYRAGAQRLIKIKTNASVNVAQQDNSDDFSSETPAKASIEVPVLKWDAAHWEGVARKMSAGFQEYPGVLASSVSITVQREVKYFVNTEGTKLRHGRTFARVVLVARGKASDGMDLATSETFESQDTEGLPAEETLVDAVAHAGKNLEALLKAPVVDPYIGPAILSGRASGVFFHEIFGHRIEGHRQKDESEGQTFTKSLNEAILPPFLSVVFDPTKHRIGGVDLNGWYDYDDEGVKARRVPLVENGILKTFLLSRAPVKGFPQSNGHGRKSPGLEVVSRQSNLLVESTRTVTNAKLRQMLIDEVKRQGKPYGLYFDAITGGYTTTSRRGLQAFKVIPLVVYRVYADGRPDELVRGADIVGTPLASFAKILSTSDKAEVFNGYCGAESGNVPVAAVSPAILVSELEIQKTDQSQDRPPLLPRPVEESAK
jgi:TldD protein